MLFHSTVNVLSCGQWLHGKVIIQEAETIIKYAGIQTFTPLDLMNVPITFRNVYIFARFNVFNVFYSTFLHLLCTVVVTAMDISRWRCIVSLPSSPHLRLSNFSPKGRIPRHRHRHRLARHADTLATILAMMSARISVSVLWNAGLSEQ